MRRAPRAAGHAAGREVRAIGHELAGFRRVHTFNVFGSRRAFLEEPTGE